MLYIHLVCHLVCVCIRNAMFALVERIAPISCKAFLDYSVNAITLTRLEVEAIVNGKETIDSTNKREQNEWLKKRSILFPRSSDSDASASGSNDK